MDISAYFGTDQVIVYVFLIIGVLDNRVIAGYLLRQGY